MWIGLCEKDYECLKTALKVCKFIEENEPVYGFWTRYYSEKISEIQDTLRKIKYTHCPFSERICNDYFRIPKREKGNLTSRREVRTLKEKVREVIDAFRAELKV